MLLSRLALLSYASIVERVRFHVADQDFSKEEVRFCCILGELTSSGIFHSAIN